MYALTHKEEYYEHIRIRPFISNSQITHVYIHFYDIVEACITN